MSSSVVTSRRMTHPRKPAPTPARIPWRLLLIALSALLAAVGVRQVQIYYSRRHTVAQSCTGDSDCPRPQQCIDKTCCLPSSSSSRRHCDPAIMVTGDETRWQIQFN